MDKIQFKIFFIMCRRSNLEWGSSSQQSTQPAANSNSDCNSIAIYIRIKWGPNVWNSRYPNSIKSENWPHFWEHFAPHYDDTNGFAKASNSNSLFFKQFSLSSLSLKDFQEFLPSSRFYRSCNVGKTM